MKKIPKLLLVALLVVLAISCNQTEEPATGEFLPDLEDSVFTELNQTRVAEGYETLDWNTELAEFSRAHSKDMGDRNFFDHTNPDGKDFPTRFTESGIQATKAGENLYMKEGGLDELDDAQQAQAVITAWMNSIPHMTTMLDADYNQGSIGCYRIEDRLYVTFNAIQNVQEL